MKIEVVVGTDRPGSNSGLVAQQVVGLLKEASGGAPFEINRLDLSEVGLGGINGQYYSEKVKRPESLVRAVDRITRADGVVWVVPEYNGSFPGCLKLFIDHLKYPASFEARPVAFIGLGGMWGGLRPVEHLQGVFGYRNAFVFPERVFLQNIWKLIGPDQRINDEKVLILMRSQASGFVSFIRALKSERLDANSRLLQAQATV